MESTSIFVGPFSPLEGPKVVIEHEITKDKQVLIQDPIGRRRFISFEDYEFRDKVSKLAALISSSTQDELVLARQLNRTLSEFEEDDDSNLERLNNQTMFKVEFQKKYGMA